jgi:chromosome segregation ATPase
MIEQEIHDLSETVKTMRDELQLKLHLASMDAKDEWDKTESRWDDLKEKLDEIGDDAVETTDELLEEAKNIGSEIQTAYTKLIDHFSS